MDELIQIITEDYTQIEINEVAPKKPQIKITGLQTDTDMTEDYFLTQLEVGTDWFSGTDVKILRSYDVKSDEPYKCVIMELPLEQLKICLAKNPIRFQLLSHLRTHKFDPVYKMLSPWPYGKKLQIRK